MKQQSSKPSRLRLPGPALIIRCMQRCINPLSLRQTVSLPQKGNMIGWKLLGSIYIYINRMTEKCSGDSSAISQEGGYSLENQHVWKSQFRSNLSRSYRKYLTCIRNQESTSTLPTFHLFRKQLGETGKTGGANCTDRQLNSLCW